uniref:Uncharacterized protein n=1 Tax=viral metagenome TaxID=1070528 RepID=A0A6C0EI83_9ZZZZ
MFKFNNQSQFSSSINTSYEPVFMNIDVKPNMCQGVYFNKKNNTSICKNRAKYLKNKSFHLCEKHKNQQFDI